MKYCEECGNELQPQIMFCPKCGTPVYQSSKQTENPSQQEDARKRMARKRGIGGEKIFLVVAVFIFIFLGCGGYFGYRYIDSMVNEQAVTEKFIEALEERDIVTLKELIRPSHEQLKITDESLEYFFALIDEKPSLMVEMRGDLVNHTEGLFSLRKDGKVFGVFDRFVIDVAAFYLTIGSSGENTSVYLKDQEVGIIENTNRTKEVGPLLPGVYQVRAERKTEYAFIEDEQQIILDGSVEQMDVYFDTKGSFVRVDANMNEARLYVNGKDTGRYISDLSEFGPINLDGSIVLWAQKDSSNGVVKSDSVTVYKEESLYFHLEEQQVETNVIKTVERSSSPPTVTYVVPREVQTESYYILPYSDTYKLTNDDLRGFSKRELRLARNEIFARYGYVFESSDLQQYFSSMPWYYPNLHYDGNLTAIEEYNVQLIKSKE